MQIHGPAHVHGPQPMSGPHRNQPTNPAQPASHVDHTDQLDLSPEAQHVSRVRELAEIRADRIVSWDRGFDAEGRQVWGAENGPYVFDKLGPNRPGGEPEEEKS